ncbi:NusG domain II-containing protein [bacterium]|nr:NusG domain II-containing protein [bacterium]
MIRKYLKVGDYFIILLLLISAVLLALINWRSEGGNRVIVYADGKKEAVLSLNQDQRYSVKGPLGLSIVEIRNGRVNMVSSPCPHQICVKMGKISKSNSMIVCVPNRIFIHIPGKNSDKLDAITQ